MLCSISGQPPAEAVISPKSGCVFERRLIETYIAEHEKDPISGSELHTEDLVAVKTAHAVTPRPPTLTSIPSLLSVFQNEWDAIALESFSLQQSLAQIRVELSHALYENDAAKRVIARLSKERDEARGALANISRSSNGTQAVVQPDQTWDLSSDVKSRIEATRESLSKTRRKRATPSDWITVDGVAKFEELETSKPRFDGAQHIALNVDGTQVLSGNGKGVGSVLGRNKKKLVQKVHATAAITQMLWQEDTAIFGTASGEVHVVSDSGSHNTFTGHNGPIVALAPHPCKDLLASVGADGSIVLYDLSNMSELAKGQAGSSAMAGQFHPDGHLLAIGGLDGKIRVLDVMSSAQAAVFELAAPIQALAFSENGTWLAVATKDSSEAAIWDLRKSAQIKTLASSGPILSLEWDYTGQFLACGGINSVEVFSYDKAVKEWSRATGLSAPALAVTWAPKAQSLVTLSPDGAIVTYGPPS